MKQMILTVSYTPGGKELSDRVAQILTDTGYDCVCLHKPAGAEFMKEYWNRVSQIIFIGAAGIAVRIAAPYIHDKMTDPGITVADEKGRYFIPILSGHIGGANEMALMLSKELCAEAVITTATDVRDVFSVDMFAKREGLLITERNKIKSISAALLRGEAVGFYSDFRVEGKLPEGLHYCRNEEDRNSFPFNLAVTDLWHKFDGEENTLRLCTADLVVGMGCKKGTACESLREFLFNTLGELGADIRQVKKIVSIDLKAEEPGLLTLCRELNITFQTYPKVLLEKVDAVSSESDFVRAITGVGNVCERAALYGSRQGQLVLGKVTGEGMTIAVAAEDRGVYFE